MEISVRMAVVAGAMPTPYRRGAPLVPKEIVVFLFAELARRGHGARAGRYVRGAARLRVRLCLPDSAPALQSKHEQHGLIALFLELGNELMLAARDRAQAGEDRDVLLAVDLERHRRRVEAGADIDLPQLLHRGVVVGGEC